MEAGANSTGRDLRAGCTDRRGSSAGMGEEALHALRMLRWRTSIVLLVGHRPLSFGTQVDDRSLSWSSSQYIVTPAIPLLLPRVTHRPADSAAVAAGRAP